MGWAASVQVPVEVPASGSRGDGAAVAPAE